jgi:trehalose-6-phosphatase
MKTKIAVLFFVLMFATQVWAIEPVAKIMAQKDAPLLITSYSAAYQRGGRYMSEGIRHAVEYKNVSDRQVVAVQIGLVSFDVWNEFMDRTGGVAIVEIAPGGSEKGTWVARAYADFAFLTGFAYVGKVRFSDGTIWAADLDAIAEEMRKIERDFDVQTLKGKPEKK